jgi:hypothetical protein
MEGFFTDNIEFKRTPKFGVEEHNSDGNSKARSICAYKAPKSLITFLELGFALYYLMAMVVSIYIRRWASLPFIWLFFSGFAYISFMSLVDFKIFRRLSMDELEDNDPETRLIQ